MGPCPIRFTTLNLPAGDMGALNAREGITEALYSPLCNERAADTPRYIALFPSIDRIMFLFRESTKAKA